MQTIIYEVVCDVCGAEATFKSETSLRVAMCRAEDGGWGISGKTCWEDRCPEHFGKKIVMKDGRVSKEGSS